MGKRRRFTREFKLEAVQLTLQEGVSIRQIADDLGLGYETLRRWRSDYLKADGQAFPGKGNPRDAEMTKLKRELARVKKERDFLKEAAAYFAKESK